MLRLSTKGRYGTRVMLDLAKHYDGSYILLKDIAKRQDISIKYLEQIISLLKSAGLVSSSRGAHGGYRLAISPSNITLKEILESLEGDLSIVKCVEVPYVCDRVNFCMSREIWKELKEKITDVLESTTLENILLKQTKTKEKEEQRDLIYHI